MESTAQYWKVARAQFGSAGTGGEPYADPGAEHRPGVAGASGRRPTAGGGARIRGGFSHAGDRRSRSHGRQLFHGPRTLLLGRGLRGPGGVCGSIQNQSQSKGNRMMRRVLTQVANAAVKSKGSVCDATYRKLVVRLGHEKAIWAIAHRLCRLTWKILHQGVRYLEYGMSQHEGCPKVRPPATARPAVPGLPSADHFFTVPGHGMTKQGCEGGFSTVRGPSRSRSSRNGTGGRGRPPQAWRPAPRLMQVFGCGRSMRHWAPWARCGSRYRILNLAGRGGMGEVNRAYDNKLDQPVALKFLPAAMSRDGAALAALPGWDYC
jgi:hypothetical protein